MSQEIRIGYVNVEVRNLAAAVPFYRDVIGLPMSYVNEEFGYAAFETASGAALGLVQVEQAQGGRHTGIGLMVDDLDAAYQRMKAANVTFQQPPTREDWGGYMAMFEDPEGNIFYLDQTQPPEDQAAEGEEPEITFDVGVELSAGSLKDK